MKVLLSYGENSNSLLNYTELNNMKTACDNMPDVNFKMTYLDIENSKNGNPNAYIEVNNTDSLTTSALHDMRTNNLITINDNVAGFYFVGLILKCVYVNNVTTRIEFQILPIQTNVVNGIDRNYDCLMTRSPNKPTYTNNIAQNIVGETVTSVNYASPISSALADFQSVPKIMLVIDKDLSPLGILNKGFGGTIPGGEIVLDSPLPACATKVGGSTVPGFVQFFDNDASLQAFVESCYNADIKVQAKIFGDDGSTYQAPQAVNYSTSGWGYSVAIKPSDLAPNTDGTLLPVVDASKVDSYYIPENIAPSNFIICREVPFQLASSETPIVVAVNLPITINSEPYFNLSSLLQIKCVASSGQSMVLDGNNILFNDGNPATGFNCKLICSLGGIDLLIGESAYSLNLCKFPEVSYSGNSFENYNTTMTRTGILSKVSNTVTRGLSVAVDEWYNYFKSGLQSNEGANSKSYEAIPLDKTSVIGSINATAWTLASFHVETTYLPSPVKSRLNAVYERFGYDDYSFITINLQAINPGYWQASIAQEMNSSGLTSNTFINSAISDGVLQQLAGGIYVKP